MSERSSRLQDATLKQDILNVFGNLAAFSRASGIDADSISRVVNLKPCREDEVKAVLDMWMQLDPDVTTPWAENIVEPTKEDFYKLHLLTLDLYAALKKSA